MLLTNDTEAFCTSSNFQIWKVFKKNREKTYRNVNAVFVGYMCPENVFEAYVWVLKKIAFTILMNNLRVITNKYLSILHLSIYRIVDAPLAEVVLWLSSSNGTIVKFCHRSATSLALWPSSTIILRKVVHRGWFSISYSIILLNVTKMTALKSFRLEETWLSFGWSVSAFVPSVFLLLFNLIFFPFNFFSLFRLHFNKTVSVRPCRPTPWPPETL